MTRWSRFWMHDRTGYGFGAVLDVRMWLVGFSVVDCYGPGLILYLGSFAVSFYGRPSA
jgi:hypothetical protein